MRRSILVPGLVLGLVLSLAFVLVRPIPTAAQMGPMGGPLSGQLDQLSGDDFDRAFLVQMTMHHVMAIMMAQPATTAAPHQETRELAQAIIDSQSAEITQMRAWAQEWYGLAIPDPQAMIGMMGGGQMPMGQMPGWQMPMGAPGGMMGGMSMMGTMAALPGPRLEATFLSMMVPHHQSAVDMARLAQDRAARQELKDLARSIETSQSQEIEQMNAWLAAWYGL
jgi:uncharacterized protein (DUF305 family)